MSAQAARDARTPDGRSWMAKLAAYRNASTKRGVLELLITAVPFAAAWGAMLIALNFGQLWLYALLLLPAAGLLMRLFMIQHDCGHGSFFPSRALNDWTGRILGVLTLTPYDYWRRSHAVHHASTGNLDQRGIGDIDTLTVGEYLGRSAWQRFCYRLYRNPVVMFGLGPLYMLGLQTRVPVGFMRKGWGPWASTQITNVAVLVTCGLVAWAVGLGPFLLIHLPVVLLAAAAGVWLFYVQHQFEDTHWSEQEEWSFHEAALHGSSHYDLPAVLRWFTANIGMHHIHHLSSRIPYYRLPDVLRDHPELRDVGRLTLLESFACVKLTLWDENSRKLISFRDARRLYA